MSATVQHRPDRGTWLVVELTLRVYAHLMPDGGDEMEFLDTPCQKNTKVFQTDEPGVRLVGEGK